MRGVNLGNWLVLEKWMNPTFLKEPEQKMKHIFV